jgi:transcriptional regulator GlxA family with amidase domain
MSRRASEDVQGFYADLVQMLFLLRGGLRTSAPVTELPAVLVSILAQMDASFATDVRMEELAEQHYLSPSTMYRLFRKHLHTTPHLYLESKRLSHARRLLKGGARVLSAALESGFSDSSSFIRLFKKRFSISPREYRDGVRTPQSPTTGGR